MDIIKFISAQNKYISTLSEDTQSTIMRYTDTLYTELNNYLENTSKKNLEFDMIVKVLDTAIANAPPLKTDITVYRGLNLPTVKNSRGRSDPLLVGYSGLYKGYISTSFDINTALTFTRQSCCLLKVVIPKGSKVLFVSGISNFSTEEEILLPRNTVFELKKLEKSPLSPYPIVIMEMVKKN